MSYNWREHVRSELNRPSDEDFARVEQEIKKKIPRDLRAFLAEHNQAYFGAPGFRRPCKPGEDDDDTVYFLTKIAGVPTNEEEAGYATLESASRAYGVDRNVPARFLGFASTLQHCALCISTEPPDEGAIYLWDPVLFDSAPNVPSMKDMHFLAPSLNEFLDSLEAWDEE